MVQLRTVLVPADNSGARRLRVIGIPHFSKRNVVGLGIIVKCTVDGAQPLGVVKDSQVVDVVVVRTRKETRRKDGSYIRFDNNAGVVVDKTGNPVGTRVFGPIPHEVREAGFGRIASLAQEIV